MLTQADIDSLMKTIKSGEPAYVYYVAHMIEGKETNMLDEHSYKSVSKFKVIKVEVENIQNAYFEYLNYINNPKNYHIEEEEYYYHPSAKYLQYFVVPNSTMEEDDDGTFPNESIDIDELIAIYENGEMHKDIILGEDIYKNENIRSIINYLKNSRSAANNSKSINSRMPSIIYGYMRRVYGSGGTIKEVIDVLNDNGAIGIFPEGTRNRTDELLLPFK